jgi:membrane fusion protein (multidrug efflux system)
MLSSRRLIFLTLIFTMFSCAKPPEMKQEKSLYVKFKASELGEIRQEFTTAGQIKAAEDIQVSAQRAGRVLKIFVHEGQYVERGAKLVEIQGKDIDADLLKAKKDFESYQSLFNEGAISELELNAYKAEFARLQSFKNDLLITASISGQVGDIQLDQGDFVKLGDPILELVKLNPLEISYTIPEKLLAKVKLGDSLHFTTDSYPDKEFSAKVKFISPRVDENTRTTLVRALIDPSKFVLKANQFVKIKQVFNHQQDILLVPEEAVYLDQGQEYIFTADLLEQDAEANNAPKAPGPPPPTHKAKKNKVVTGLRKPGFVQILDGVNEGDLIVYAGLTSIYDGAKLIQVKETDTN